MKLHTEREHIERGGVEKETTFTIKTTAKAFDILSSGLYTDNILAIVRELSCNALDAHVDAGKPDVPFEIHLPNSLEPFFSIKDFGTGLSDDEIQGEKVYIGEDYTRVGGLYTTYFDSTKTDSNDYIGALGLGSKSPFSYTNAFEVISRHEGKRTIYSIFLNEDGIPSVARMGTFDTDEPNGLEVKITVKKEDFRDFRYKTASALRFFPTKPIVTGDKYFEFETLPNYRFDGDGWFVAKKGWNDHAFVAVQGNVEYKVDIGQLDLDPIELNFFKKAHVCAFFDIGDLEVAASREEIRYDTRSKEALREKTRQIRTDMTKIVEKKIKDLKAPYNTKWYAFIMLDEYSYELFGEKNLLRNFVDLSATHNRILQSYVNDDRQVTLCERYGHSVIKYGPGRRQGTLAKTATAHIEPDKKICVVYGDIKTGFTNRMKTWLFDYELNKNRYSHVIYIREYTEKEAYNAQYDPRTKRRKSVNLDKELKAILKSLGNPEMFKLSEIAPKSIARKSRALPLYTYAGNTSQYSYSGGNVAWNKARPGVAAEMINTGGLYFPMKHQSHIMFQMEGTRMHLTHRGYKVLMELLVKFYNDKNNTEFSFNDVVGATKLTCKTLDADDKWINIFDYFMSFSPEYLETFEFLRRWNATRDAFNIKDLIPNNEFVKQVNELDDSSPFKKAVSTITAEYHLNVDNITVATKMMELDSRYGGRKYHKDDPKPYFKETAFKGYPMLNVVGSINSDDIEPIFDYIKLIDDSNR